MASRRKASLRTAEAAVAEPPVQNAAEGSPSADRATPPAATEAEVRVAAYAAQLSTRDLAAAREAADKGESMTWDECISRNQDKDSPENFCGYLKARKEGTYKGGDSRAAALGMTDEAEEQAELVGYQALASMVAQAQASLKEIASLVGDLIASEQNEPATSTIDEASETTVETAKLGAVLAFCGHVTGTIYGIQDLCRRMLTQAGAYNGYPTGVGEAVAMPSMLEAAASADDAVEYLTRLGKALGQIKLPDDHPLAASLTATRERIKTAKVAFSARAAARSKGEMGLLQSMHDSAVAMGAQCQEQRAAAAAVKPCGCGAAEGEQDMSKAERVKALIAKGTTPFTEADQAYLETLCDGRLTALEAIEAPKPPEAPPVPATLDEFLATAPDALKPAVDETKQIVAAQRAATAARKTELVTKLKTAQSAFDEAELTAMSIEQLEKLTRVASATAETKETPAVDFSGQSTPRTAAKTGDEDESVPPPPDLTKRILEARKAS